MQLSTEQVDSVLAGMTYPAQRWEVLTWAEYNGAGRVILDALYGVPEQRFTQAEDIVRAVAARGELVAAHTGRSRCPRHGRRARGLAA